MFTIKTTVAALGRNRRGDPFSQCHSRPSFCHNRTEAPACIENTSHVRLACAQALPAIIVRQKDPVYRSIAYSLFLSDSDPVHCPEQATPTRGEKRSLFTLQQRYSLEPCLPVPATRIAELRTNRGKRNTNTNYWC